MPIQFSFYTGAYFLCTLYFFYSLKLISFAVPLFTLLFILYTLFFPLTSLPIFAWHATIVLLEAFVEIALIHKADFETNLGDGIFSFED